MVAGFEPAIRSFADLRLSHLAIPPICMDRIGFEPITSRLKGVYSTIELAVHKDDVGIEPTMKAP